MPSAYARRAFITTFRAKAISASPWLKAIGERSGVSWRIVSSETKCAKRLRRYADLYRADAKDGKGCLCGVLAAELADLPVPVQSAVRAFFDDNVAWSIRDCRGPRFPLNPAHQDLGPAVGPDDSRHSPGRDAHGARAGRCRSVQYCSIHCDRDRAGLNPFFQRTLPTSRKDTGCLTWDLFSPAGGARTMSLEGKVVVITGGGTGTRGGCRKGDSIGGSQRRSQWVAPG